MTDPTNFQPDLTVRNAIRHILSKGGSTGITPEDPSFSEYPREIASRLAGINLAAKDHPDLNISLASDKEHLRDTVRKLNDKRDEIDAEGVFVIIN